MGKISYEWIKDRNGLYCIEVIKKRGKITVAEIQEAIRDNSALCEYLYAIKFHVREDDFDGWSAEDPVGDVLHVYQIADGEDCPICFVDMVVDYCPHCGEMLNKEG